MKQLGYYAKDENGNLFQFEWGANDEFNILNSDGDYVMADPKDYVILEIGVFADRTNGLSEVQLQRRLVLLKQLAQAINDDLAKMGYADEEGCVNTCSVEDAGADGSLGANVVNLFLLADPNNDYAEVNFKTEAEYIAIHNPQPKWEQVDTGIELNEDFMPNSNITYSIEFDGVDRFRATIDQQCFDARMVGVEDAPKVLIYTLDRPLTDFTEDEKKDILQYRGLTLSDGFEAIDVFMEKSFVTLEGVQIEIEATVTTTIKLGEGESLEDLQNRDVDIYLHNSGYSMFRDKTDLGVDKSNIKIL